MRSLKSDHIARILKNPRFIDINDGALNREVRYIIKHYKNNDIKLKRLALPLFVPRLGSEEVDIATWETNVDNRTTSYVMFTDTEDFYLKKQADALSPDPIEPLIKTYMLEDWVLRDAEYYGYTYIDKKIPLDVPNSLNQIPFAFNKFKIKNIDFEDYRNYSGYTLIRKLEPLNISLALELIPVAVNKIKTKKEKKINNRNRADRLTQNNIMDLLHGRRFDWFLTITFDANKIDRNDPAQCSKKLRKTLNNLKTRKYKNLEYFGVWEWHKDEKAIHYHMLINGIDDVEFTPAIDNRKTYIKNGVEVKNRFFGKQIKQNKKLVYNLNLMKFGFTTATRVGDSAKTISYITKYIVKQFGADYIPYMDRARRYICSASFEKPDKYSLTEKEYLRLSKQPDNWLCSNTNNLDFDNAKIIQEGSDTQNLIVLFENASKNESVS